MPVSLAVTAWFSRHFGTLAENQAAQNTLLSVQLVPGCSFSQQRRAFDLEYADLHYAHIDSKTKLKRIWSGRQGQPKKWDVLKRIYLKRSIRSH